VRKLYRWLAVALLAFFFLYLVPGLYGSATARPPPGLQAAARRSLSASDPGATERGGHAEILGRSLLAVGWGGGGDPGLTAAQRAVRAALFLSVSLINLLAVSTMWARAADVFSSDAGETAIHLTGIGMNASDSGAGSAHHPHSIAIMAARRFPNVPALSSCAVGEPIDRLSEM